jgi:D-alanyl-D-alanine carboxypeptidase
VQTSTFRRLAVLLAAGLAAWPATAVARQAPAAIVIDANSGRTLHADAPDDERYPASLTKMMTLFIVFEEMAAGRLTEADRITFSERASARPPSKLGLEPGHSLTLGEAIRALITKSANDVATAVAERVAGSEAAFGRRMTATARRLGMNHTVYRNASGLPDSEQVTTARDVAALVLALQERYPRQARLFALQRFNFRGRTYRNHNRLLGRLRGIDGMKTGYTRAAGFNIATSLRRGGKHLVGVVMGQKTGRIRDRVMRNLLLAALPKASRVKRRRQPPALVAARPRLVARPQLAMRPVSPMARTAPPAPPAMRPPARTADAQAPGRPPSTLAAQLVRLEQTSTAPAHVAASSAFLRGLMSEPATARRPAAAGTATHQIQVGAFFDESDAQRALEGARSRAGALLAGSRALTLRVASKPRTIYRARFAGFDRDEAARTCAQLKRAAIDCFVASAR